METTPATAPSPAQSHETEAARQLPELAPVAEPERIEALDVVRGVALLGILLVNMRYFSQPVGIHSQWVPPAEMSALDAAAHWFIKIFGEGKFYPLYSMLFGMGLVLMYTRVKARGGRFHAVYLRRLAALLLIGLVHALLLWYGDILVVYSLTALILFGFAAARARSLITTGLVLVGVSAVVGLAVTSLGVVFGEAAFAAAKGVEPEILTEGTPLSRLFEGFSGEQPIMGEMDPRWMAYETEAYRDGGFLQAFGFRAITWVAMIAFVYLLMGMGVHVLGMFFLGAGLMKLGIFEPRRRPLLRKLLGLGFGVALPVVVLFTLAPLFLPWPWDHALYLPVLFIFGPMVSLAYLAGVTLLVTSGRLRAVAAAIARAGRMGLTSYLLETVLATSLMYWWGLGLFGTISPAEEIGLTLLIYATVVAFANAWMRLARFGPMEWVWRSATYWRVPRLWR